MEHPEMIEILRTLRLENLRSSRFYARLANTDMDRIRKEAYKASAEGCKRNSQALFKAINLLARTQ